MAFTKYKEVVVRKEHICAKCGGWIFVGDRAKRGVTTDRELTSNILTAYWCAACLN
jgi:hypothetical protein